METIFEAEQPPSPSLAGRILHSKELGMAFLLLLCIMGLYLFAYRNIRFFIVPTSSMEPTLFPEDMIITLNAPRYQRGDIVVTYDDGEYVVKRIIGLPGDNIGIVDGALFINGKYASEPYMREPMVYFIEQPVRIPEGRFFYLGDNRNHSEDSSLGFTAGSGERLRNDPLAYLGHLDLIIGKVRFIYYPYSRFGTVPSYPLINTAGQ